MLLASLLICFVIILLLVYFLINSKSDYWKRRNVPHLKPTFLFGNYKDYILLKRYYGFIAQDICRKFPNEPYVGSFYGTEPALIVQDPEVIKLVMTKEFIFFSGREITKYCKCETVTHNIFFNGGEEWKLHRQNLTLLFTSSKIRNMFYLIQNCRDVLEEILNKEVSESYDVDVKSLATRYTMDCIGSCVFGINSNVMTNNVNTNVFSVIGAEIFSTTTTRALKLIFRAIWPSVFYGLRQQIFSPEIQKFFEHTITKVFESRRFKETSRNDFIDILLSWKNKTLINENASTPDSENKSTLNDINVTNELLVGQCVLFFGAGFETSATTMSLTLYEIAKNKEVQEKIIEEVDQYFEKTNGKVEYECINDLPYLNACVYETMRLYPLFGILTRETMDDYKLPSGLLLEKGLRIHIPVYHLHHNPEHFPDPENYIPERFYGEEKQKVTPYTFLPFGEEPRICIGSRFSRMQMFPGLLTVFKNYKIELTSDTPKKLDFVPAGLVTQIKNKINVKFIKRHNKM